MMITLISWFDNEMSVLSDSTMAGALGICNAASCANATHQPCRRGLA